MWEVTLVPPFCMTRWTEPACLVGKHQQPLFPAVRTPDASETTHRVAAVEITVHHLLHNRAKIAVLALKARLILQEELLKIMEKDSVENSPLRMKLTVNPCHGRDEDSKSGPIQRRMPQRLFIPWVGPAKSSVKSLMQYFQTFSFKLLTLN